MILVSCREEDAPPPVAMTDEERNKMILLKELDRFLVEYANIEVYKREVEPEAVSDQNGAPLDSVPAK
jgi:hypothetical protein